MGREGGRLGSSGEKKTLEVRGVGGGGWEDDDVSWGRVMSSGQG